MKLMRIAGAVKWRTSIGALLMTISVVDAENIALNKPATANATYADYLPSRAVDGDRNNPWLAPSHGTPSNPYWITIDLQAIRSIYRITLVGPASVTYTGYTYLYEVDASADGTNWTSLGTGTLIDTTDPVDMIYPGGQHLRYVRYTVTGGTHWAGLYEMEVFPLVEIASCSVSQTNTVELALTNCLADVTNTVQRSHDLTDAAAWTNVAEFTGVTETTNWFEVLDSGWNSVFYRVRSSEGPRP